MIKLESRAIIEVSGPDCVKFLNTLLTNEIENMPPKSALFCALLTPQGKFLFDIFAFRDNENSFFLDACFGSELVQKLGVYKMRSDVQIMLRDDLAVFAQTETPNSNHTSFPDPRDSKLGSRIFAPPNSPQTGDFAAYEQLRLSLGIPDLAQDLIREQDFALEGLLDELGAIDFTRAAMLAKK